MTKCALTEMVNSYSVWVSNTSEFKIAGKVNHSADTNDYCKKEAQMQAGQRDSESFIWHDLATNAMLLLFEKKKTKLCSKGLLDIHYLLNKIRLDET